MQKTDDRKALLEAFPTMSKPRLRKLWQEYFGVRQTQDSASCLCGVCWVIRFRKQSSDLIHVQLNAVYYINM